MRIKRIQPVLLALVILGAVSCQKEVDYVDLGGNPGNPGNPSNPSNPSNQSIIGDWKFARMVIDMNIKATTTGGSLTMITEMSGGFVSFNEQGTVKIESNKLTATGIGYSVDTTFKNTVTADGMSVSELAPWKYDMPPTSSSSSFQQISADSLALQGTIVNADIPAGTSAIQPSGIKISWSGDTLLLTSRSNQVINMNQGGASSVANYNIRQVIKLVK